MIIVNPIKTKESREIVTRGGSYNSDTPWITISTRGGIQKDSYIPRRGSRFKRVLKWLK